MATADPNMAQVTLKRAHSLRGRDVLPVVMRISSLSLEDWSKRLESHPLASFSSRHALESYSGEELASEFRKLTGYEISVSCKMKWKRIAHNIPLFYHNFLKFSMAQDRRRQVQGFSQNLQKQIVILTIEIEFICKQRLISCNILYELDSFWVPL